MLISKVLMSLKCCVCIFDGVSVCDNHFPIFAPSLQLRNLVIQLYATRYGGAIKLGPRHPLNLTKLDSFVDGVYNPCLGGDWVSLNCICISFFFHSCTRFKKKNCGLNSKIKYVCRMILCDEGVG